jgi:hypothetical protein
LIRLPRVKREEILNPVPKIRELCNPRTKENPMRTKRRIRKTTRRMTSRIDL